MKKEFWHERWENGQIGFHQQEINRHLQAHWPSMAVSPASLVFVPMCGKSLDMLWLREQGHEVLGVELSPKAVIEFFREFECAAEPYSSGNFAACRSDGLNILCGDFFDLTRAETSNVAAVYDRAALIALPPDMRRRYVDHLARILPSGASILLITTEYLQEEMQGPPFSVDPSEVEALYSEYGQIKILDRSDVLAANPGFRERGLSALAETTYLIRLR